MVQLGTRLSAGSSAALVALLLAACSPSVGPLPEPAVTWPPPPADVTPVPPPDLACIARMGPRPQHVPPRPIGSQSLSLLPKGPAHVFSIVPVWRGAAEIGADGSVSGVRTIQSFKVDPPAPELEASVIAAIRQWKYEPACVDGRPVKAELELTVRIELR